MNIHLYEIKKNVNLTTTKTLPSLYTVKVQYVQDSKAYLTWINELDKC